MKRLVALLTADLVEDVVDALVTHGVQGVTLEPVTDALAEKSSDGRTAEPWVRLEVVIESHRADDAIESIETILDSIEGPGRLPHLVVENVEAVVHIRSGRILT